MEFTTVGGFMMCSYDPLVAMAGAGLFGIGTVTSFMISKKEKEQALNMSYRHNESVRHHGSRGVGFLFPYVMGYLSRSHDRGTPVYHNESPVARYNHHHASNYRSSHSHSHSRVRR